MGKNLAWSDAENNYLDQIGGTDHIVVLCRKYCRVASLKGWTKRSHGAIKEQLSVLGYSWRPELDGWSGGGLAKILGVPPNRVNAWCRKGKLTSSNVKGFRERRIFRSDFQLFAETYPHMLRDVDELNLRMVLDDRTIALIMAQEPRLKSIPVYSTRTGKVYESIAQAAKHEYCCIESVSRAVRYKKPTKSGISFVKVEKDFAA